ncbi:MAG TPA: tetratricopeptide repeat protein, partial [Bryobacteraceae bacterium]|nr:tetratricopeptide repeat protein [Bryobacteraceae bacterium]
DPADEHIALEYAFLCFETRKQAEARRVFDRLRRTAAAPARATAQQAFDNIDRPLGEGIARWSAVVAQRPGDFSAHVELARLSEQRDALEPAAGHYLAAWRIRPAERELLLDAGRVWRALGRDELASAALLAASRGSRRRVAEQARDLLPLGTPDAGAFRRAIELDPENLELRRELVRLLLASRQNAEAEKELRAIAERAPQDLESAAQLGILLFERKDRAGAMVWLDRVFKSGDDELIERVRSALRMPAAERRRKAAPAPEAAPPHPADDPAAATELGPKQMGERSYRAGYLQDALRYFQSAHDLDPLDFGVLLKLGWTYNALHEDRLAMAWFDLARRSPDRAVAAEASRAYRNLRPAFARWRVTTWAFPFYSSRWRDVFSYAQLKIDRKLGEAPIRPYISMRFIGDTRRMEEAASAAAVPQYLSERSLIAALGLATDTWHGFTLWGEAGSSIRYTGAEGRGRMVPDYRGGIAFARGAGRLLGSRRAGWFAETHDDGVFVSRFDNDFLIYSQNQTGYTLPPLGGLLAQAYWNTNLTCDTRRQRWANFYESGPGLRVRWSSLPPSLVFSVNVLRGSYLMTEEDRAQMFKDVRAGFWYALTR